MCVRAHALVCLKSRRTRKVRVTRRMDMPGMFLKSRLATETAVIINVVIVIIMHNIIITLIIII